MVRIQVRQPFDFARYTRYAHGYSQVVKIASLLDTKVERPERAKRVEGSIMNYFIYIIRFSNDSLYIGQTNDLESRLLQHKNKTTKASKFSKDNGVFELVYQEVFNSRLDSMRREKQLKGWSRAKKEALIKGDKKLLKEL